MERELDFKEKKLTELEAELKIMRNEREQFVEMGVRLEIQTKELGLMTRDLKSHGSGNKKRSPRNVTQTAAKSSKSTKPGTATTASSQILSFKKFIQKRLGGNSTRKLGGGALVGKQIGSPLDITAVSNNNHMNLTMAMPCRTSPRGGAFDKGNMTMRSPD